MHCATIKGGNYYCTITSTVELVVHQWKCLAGSLLALDSVRPEQDRMRRLLAAPVELEIKTNTSSPLPHGILSCLKLTRKEILFGLFWRIPGDCLNGGLVKSLECMQQSCCFHSDFEVQIKHSRLLISYHFSIFIKQWVHCWDTLTHMHTLVQLILQLHLHLAKFTRKSREGFISVPGQ